ncbi:2,3,4,5-tetrahydropyridine-2,6-dicarboxylate N-succinyltransferase [Thauera humireducens]|uniref:2,3,4,5-tetrahydropyridine-2,6-dicarboxylate N-succinyltransferase n=1 Tax=Thauera humireducens TaxID=1134435 RepID=UPI003C757F79
MHALQQIIDDAFENRASLSPTSAPAEIRNAVEEVIAGLDAGTLRVAGKDGQWVVNQWIKKAVLISFRLRDNEVVQAGGLNFYDKVATRIRRLRPSSSASGFRVVPPAVARKGSFIGKNVVLMPSYVNIGAYVDEGTMVDTWAAVGSCAQIGKNVHLSGGVGIGGVLEPVQAGPVIIEDNVFVGARSKWSKASSSRRTRCCRWAYTSARAPRSTTARRARSPMAACRRVPSWCRAACPRPLRQVRPVLRRHREEGRCADPRQDRHRRTAARRLIAFSTTGAVIPRSLPHREP